MLLEVFALFGRGFGDFDAIQPDREQRKIKLGQQHSLLHPRRGRKQSSLEAQAARFGRQADAARLTAPTLCRCHAGQT